ncbi:MAG: replication factor C large subunit [Candidatus Aenigmatarchaeota archaeon]
MEKLWVDKYKPKSVKEIVGQTSALNEILRWLNSWKPGKALALIGPPGVGKTLIPEVIANEKNWLLTQINASDQRDASTIESKLLEAVKEKPIFHKGKLILIDEVDGITVNDRGGINAIIKVIKESKFPIILTANDIYLPKLQPLRQYATIIKLSKIDTRTIEKRLREICENEDIKVEEDVLRTLARWSSGDLRSAITDLQMLCEGKKEITQKDFESIGYRERENNIFNVLPLIFRSKNINAAKMAIENCDKDPDEIFWWIEANLPQEFEDKEALAKAYDLLSKIDLFRQKVSIQQNWRFKLYMTELMASFSFVGEPSHKFIKYSSPDRFYALIYAKTERAEMKQIYEKIGKYTHCSEKQVKNFYMPYLKLIISDKTNREEEAKGGIELTKEEVELILSKK